MKKRISLVLLLSIALSCILFPMAYAQAVQSATLTDAECDAVAVKAGKQFRVGTAQEAYDDGDLSGYYAYTDFATVTSKDAAAGKTLTLIADIDTGSTAYIIDSACTIDGNGHTITVNRSGILFNITKDCTVVNLTAINNGSGGALQVKDGATLTVQDSTLKNPNAITWGTVIVQTSSTLVLEKGAHIIVTGKVGNNLRCSGVYLQMAGSSCEVRSGAQIDTTGNTFTINNDVKNKSTVTVLGGTIVTARRVWAAFNTGYTISIKGGKITSTSTTDPMILVKNDTTVGSSTVEISGGEFVGNTKLIDTEDYAGLKLSGTVKWNGNVIYSEPDEDTVAKPEVNLRLPGGQSATKDNSGIRFVSRVDQKWLDSLTNDQVTVSTGTLILPGFLLENGALTSSALERTTNLKLPNEGWLNAATAEADGCYRFSGSMVGLTAESLTREIAGVGYVTLTIKDVGTYTFWSMPTVGTVRELANAYDDSGADSAQTEILTYFRGTVD